MLKNYFKIALAVLKRRKFFTFISLFGISFTLTILMVVTSFLDHLINANEPEVNRDKSLYVVFLRQKNIKENWTKQTPGSYHFFDHYVGSMKTPEKIAVSSLFSPSNTYVKSKKIVVNLKYTNTDYWDVLKYSFTEGKPYTLQQVNNAEKVAVISEQTRKDYFGAGASVVGKYIETDNVQYRVVGVVKNIPVTMPYIYADMYLPYTLSKGDYNTTDIDGNFVGILMAKSKNDVAKMQKEFASMIKKVPLKDKQFNSLEAHADHYLDTYTRQLLGDDNSSGGTAFSMILTALALLFMLLPTLNLININISRIMERSSEIGVRKAFGASSNTLVYQFIVENIIFTFIGGFIGIILSYIAITIINNSNLIEHAHLQLDMTVLAISFIACFAFGLFSGVYPAWRMSRLHVVNALKAS